MYGIIGGKGEGSTCNDSQLLLLMGEELQKCARVCVRVMGLHYIANKKPLLQFITSLHWNPLCCLNFLTIILAVAFRIYDMDKDGYISNGELFQVLKMMVGNNLKDTQLQQIVDKTIINADKDGDGRISFEEFCAVSAFK